MAGVILGRRPSDVLRARYLLVDSAVDRRSVLMARLIIGIDPGHKGGIALLNPANPAPLHVFPFPLMGREIDWCQTAKNLQYVYSLDRPPKEADKAYFNLRTMVAFVEKNHSMPKQGVASSFKFGMAYGGILAILGAMKIPVRLVTPPAWKKVVLSGTKKDKPAAIAYCRRRWPSVSLIPEGCRKPHDGMADALCIAAYGETVL